MTNPDVDSRRVRNRASFRKEATYPSVSLESTPRPHIEKPKKAPTRTIVSRPQAPRISKSKVVTEDILEKWRPLNDKMREHLIRMINSHIPSILDPLRSQARRDFMFEHLQEIISKIDLRLKNCILPAGHIDYSRLDSQNQKLEDSLSEHVLQLTRLEKDVASDITAYESDVIRLEKLVAEVNHYELIKNQLMLLAPNNRSGNT